MRRFLFFTVIISVIVIGCKENPDIMLEREKRLLAQYLELNNITASPLPNGLYFLETISGTGLTPETGNFVIIEYTGRLIDGRVFDTTDEQIAINKGIVSTNVLYGPAKVQMDRLNVKGMEEGLKLMKEGGQAMLIVPSTLGYGASNVNNVPAYSTLIYDVKLIKVIKDPKAYEILELQNYLGLYIDSVGLTIQTKKYIVAKDTIKWYYIEKIAGTGDSIKKDYKVYIYYEGKLVDGRIFDGNFGKTTPFNFIVGGTSVIKGMDLAVKEMKKDAKARVVLPSSIGYGEVGSGSKIPPFSPLVFDILIVNFDTVLTK